MPIARRNMAAIQRAERLLAEVRDHGWTIEFIQPAAGDLIRPARADGRVHIVAADADQPPIPGCDVESLLTRRFRLICGPLLLLSCYGGTLNRVFDDELLCCACHDAFPTNDDQGLIYYHNTEDLQERSAAGNSHLRRLRRIDAAGR